MNNDYITSSIKKIIESEKINVIQHKSIPSGDGGISFGQVLYAEAYNLFYNK